MKKLTIALLLSILTAFWGNLPALAAEKKSNSTTAKKTTATKGKTSPQKTANTKASGKTTAKASSKTTTKTAAKSKNTKTTAARSSPGKQPVARASASKSRKVSIQPQPWNDGPLAFHSSSVLVLDQLTGSTLLEKNANAKLPIASISKLMTAMVVLDAGQDLNEVIQITDDDVDYLKNTRSHLRVGTAMTRDTALLLALMSSENRAAHALARNYPGGLVNFMAAMNRKAWSLGLTSTRFEEPTGLSSNNVSSAHDLARMVGAAHQYTKIREYSTTARAEIDLGTHVHEFGNTNVLIKNPQWQIGLSKTGYISEAGRCLVMQAWVAEKPVIIVLLDAAGKTNRLGDANRIKRWMESASNTQPGKATGA